MSAFCLYRTIGTATIRESPCISMFFNKRRDKLRVTKKALDRIPTRWKFVIAGLIGSGTSLLILTIWCPRPIDEKSTCNVSSKLIPTIQLFGRMPEVRLYNDEKSSAYCNIWACNTVICSSISESLDPGLVASDFIKQIFQEQCRSKNVIEQLTFESCMFPNNRLKPNWLTTNLTIEKLSFRNCGLENFAKGSFGSTIFVNLKTLDVATGSIRSLQKWTFDELKNLKNLQIDDNIVNEAESDLLASVADSLEILVLDGCLKNIQVLANITGYTSLTKVQILSIQRNSIGTLSSDIFKSVPNVVSLYLGQSKIERIAVDSLKNTRSLKFLDLKNNLLKILPSGVFTSVLSKYPDFNISMAENPWNCSCEFKWIHDMIKNYPGTLTEIPKCESPEKNAFLYFTNAQFCDNTTSLTTPYTTTLRTTTTTKKNITNENDEKVPNSVRFTCQNYESMEIPRTTRKLFSVEEWQFPPRYRDFSLNPLENGDVSVNLKINEIHVSLIWFRSNDYQTDDISSLETIDCVTNVRGSFILTNLASDVSYTICLLVDLKKLSSPLDCLATRTRSIYTPNDDTWLTENDKSFVISITIILFLIICLISVISSFWIIRKNPSLLRGSKRIVMVRKRGIEALVMPRGITVKSHDESKNSYKEKKWSNVNFVKKHCEPSYLTPLEHRKSISTLLSRNNSSPREPMRRKDSKVSRVSSQYSGGSYVSGIEASPIELYNWRNNTRTRSYSACMENDEFEEIPPTPPSRPHNHRSIDRSIPSLSLVIDANNPQDTNELYFHDPDNEEDRESTQIKFIDL